MDPGGGVRVVAVAVVACLAPLVLPGAASAQAKSTLPRKKLEEIEKIEGIAHQFPAGEPKKGLEVVLQARRMALPQKLLWEYATDPFPQPSEDEPTKRFVKKGYHFVHCREPADPLRIVFARDGNRFDVETSGIDPNQLELRLNPAMIDPAKNVVVKLNGKPVADRRPVPDFATILPTLDARMDRTLVFDRRVRIATASN
jgi:hypothetical protein